MINVPEHLLNEYPISVHSEHLFHWIIMIYGTHSVNMWVTWFVRQVIKLPAHLVTPIYANKDTDPVGVCENVAHYFKTHT